MPTENPGPPGNPLQNPGVEPDDVTPGHPDAKTFYVPKAQIELHGVNGFRIVVDRLRWQILKDQREDMIAEAGQGCISSPTGPSC